MACRKTSRRKQFIDIQKLIMNRIIFIIIIIIIYEFLLIIIVKINN